MSHMQQPSRIEIIIFYRNQIRKFEDLGLGKRTENGVKITDELMNATRRRLCQLQNKNLI